MSSTNHQGSTDAPSERDRADAPRPLDHYRADAAGPLDPGVYRVVGGDDDGVALLRVAANGRRVHSGVVVHLPREALDALAPASNPDTGLGRLRQVPADLAAHPLLSGSALLALAVGGTLLATTTGDAADGGTMLLAVGAGVLWFVAR